MCVVHILILRVCMSWSGGGMRGPECLSISLLVIEAGSPMVPELAHSLSLASQLAQGTLSLLSEQRMTSGLEFL